VDIRRWTLNLGVRFRLLQWEDRGADAAGGRLHPGTALRRGEERSELEGHQPAVGVAIRLSALIAVLGGQDRATEPRADVLQFGTSSPLSKRSSGMKSSPARLAASSH